MKALNKIKLNYWNVIKIKTKNIIQNINTIINSKSYLNVAMDNNH